MAMFVCDHCKTYENTVFGNYWAAIEPNRLCYACIHGKWHNKFLRQRVTSGETGRLEVNAKPTLVPFND